ncbi:MAG TPA: hypothetical protein VEA69_15135 [Tepidisphaeraceae bacterium]|nr:hypothetical protein [Tepidisphaeraceae bacterium]
MPCSEKKLAANRANARKSTGPRTPAGKLASARNATRHALAARVDPAYLHPDDRALYATLLGALTAEHDPRTPTATLLVTRLALLAVRLARCALAEAELPTSILDARQSAEYRRYESDVAAWKHRHAKLAAAHGRPHADRQCPPPPKPGCLTETEDDPEKPDHPVVCLADACAARHDAKNPYARLQRYESATHRQFHQTLKTLQALSANTPDDDEDHSDGRAASTASAPPPNPTDSQVEPTPTTHVTACLFADSPTPVHDPATPRAELPNEPTDTDPAPTRASASLTVIPSVLTRDLAGPSGPAPSPEVLPNACTPADPPPVHAPNDQTNPPTATHPPAYSPKPSTDKMTHLPNP